MDWTSLGFKSLQVFKSPLMQLLCSLRILLDPFGFQEAPRTTVQKNRNTWKNTPYYTQKYSKGHQKKINLEWYGHNMGVFQWCQATLQHICKIQCQVWWWSQERRLASAGALWVQQVAKHVVRICVQPWGPWWWWLCWRRKLRRARRELPPERIWPPMYEGRPHGRPHSHRPQRPFAFSLEKEWKPWLHPHALGATFWPKCRWRLDRRPVVACCTCCNCCSNGRLKGLACSEPCRSSGLMSVKARSFKLRSAETSPR